MQWHFSSRVLLLPCFSSSIANMRAELINFLTKAMATGGKFTSIDPESEDDCHEYNL